MTRLVLLSGWGIDARIWQPLDAHWPIDLAVSTPDWPGYGRRSPLETPSDLAALAEAMTESLPRDAVWVGWSLGGLLASALLDHLDTPRGLVLLGMGPRFCAPGGIPSEELAAFVQAFERDPRATRAHFLRWQVQGEPSPRRAHRRLIDLIGHTAEADDATLAAGLAQLAELDVTQPLAAASCPVRRIAGEHDPLLSPALRASANHRLPAAGHCPMLSCPETLANMLVEVTQDIATPTAQERMT